MSPCMTATGRMPRSLNGTQSLSNLSHRSTVDAMSRHCREQFVHLHEQPILDNLHRFFKIHFEGDKMRFFFQSIISLLNQAARSMKPAAPRRDSSRFRRTRSEGPLMSEMWVAVCDSGHLLMRNCRSWMRSTSSTDVTGCGLHESECMARSRLVILHVRTNNRPDAMDFGLSAKTQSDWPAIPLSKLFPRAAQERGLFYPRLRSAVACVRRCLACPRCAYRVVGRT